MWMTGKPVRVIVIDLQLRHWGIRPGGKWNQRGKKKQKHEEAPQIISSFQKVVVYFIFCFCVLIPSHLGLDRGRALFIQLTFSNFSPVPYKSMKQVISMLRNK